MHQPKVIAYPSYSFQKESVQKIQNTSLADRVDFLRKTIKGQKEQFKKQIGLKFEQFLRLIENIYFEITLEYSYFLKNIFQPTNQLQEFYFARRKNSSETNSMSKKEKLMILMTSLPFKLFINCKPQQQKYFEIDEHFPGHQRKEHYECICSRKFVLIVLEKCVVH